jgi:putative ABC transport system ATP-binding protein
MVVLRSVEKVYEGTAGRFPALQGIDLEVHAGEFVSIIGKSGSGKSTLINMITGIDKPTAGGIFIGGVAVHELSEEQIALWRGKTVGVIFQFFQLLPTLTAAENILLPMDYLKQEEKAVRPEVALKLLERVGMSEFAHRFPSELSGGQQQCIAIARALANDPPILAADEPTGNLDSTSAIMILDLFKRLAKAGKTILMVTHDKDLAAFARRTVVISDGRVVEDRRNGHTIMVAEETRQEGTGDGDSPDPA